MEKFFDQSKDLAQKPTSDSGFFSEYESVLTEDEKRGELIRNLEKAQDEFNKSNKEINDLLGSYKNNFADKIADEQRLMELSDSLTQAEASLKSLRYQIDYINQGHERLHSNLNSQALKN